MKPDHDQSPDESAQREAVFAEWEQRAQTPPRQGWRGLFRRERWQDQLDADAMGEEDAYVAPPKRAAFPPSFLLLWGLGLAFLALEPTLDLRYTLFGPSAAVELGEPGAFHLEAAAPNVRARVTDWAHSDRGTYSQTLSDYEVLALTSVPVLVRRAPEGRPPPNTAELYRGEGRLLRLDNVGSTFLERWVSPSARYATVRQQFQALGQLPMTGPCWLLLEGDLPRSAILPLVAPLLLWVGAFLFLFSAWRSYRLRHSRR